MNDLAEGVEAIRAAEAQRARLQNEHSKRIYDELLDGFNKERAKDKDKEAFEIPIRYEIHHGPEFDFAVGEFNTLIKKRGFVVLSMDYQTIDASRSVSVATYIVHVAKKKESAKCVIC